MANDERAFGPADPEVVRTESVDPQSGVTTVYVDFVREGQLLFRQREDTFPGSGPRRLIIESPEESSRSYLVWASQDIPDRFACLEINTDEGTIKSLSVNLAESLGKKMSVLVFADFDHEGTVGEVNFCLEPVSQGPDQVISMSGAGGVFYEDLKSMAEIWVNFVPQIDGRFRVDVMDRDDKPLTGDLIAAGQKFQYEEYVFNLAKKFGDGFQINLRNLLAAGEKFEYEFGNVPMDQFYEVISTVNPTGWEKALDMIPAKRNE